MNAAITGWSVLTPIGTTREAFADAVRAGRSAIAPAARFDALRGQSRLAGLLPLPIDYKRFIAPARLRRMDALSRQIVYAACEAFAHAGLAQRAVPPERRAVVIASAINHSESIEQFFVSLLEEGPEGANPILFPSTIPNSAGGLLAIELACRGPNLTVAQKETSAEAALRLAAELLARDEADVVLVAAGDSLTPAAWDGLAHLRVLSRTARGRNEGMWPFSARRNGFVAGEGVAAVVLEREEAAQATGARVFGRLVGIAEALQPCAPLRYPTDPAPLAQAAATLLRASTRDPGALAFVSSSANSTRSLDACEAQVIRQTAQALGRGENDLPTAAIKSLTGEIGAGGLIRILAALTACESGVCPPLPFDSDSYDPEFDLRLSYRNAPVRIQGTDFLHLATAAGGHQMALRLTSQ